jgi:hypothetical protein
MADLSDRMRADLEARGVVPVEDDQVTVPSNWADEVECEIPLGTVPTVVEDTSVAIGDDLQPIDFEQEDHLFDGPVSLNLHTDQETNRNALDARATVAPFHMTPQQREGQLPDKAYSGPTTLLAGPESLKRTILFALSHRPDGVKEAKKRFIAHVRASANAIKTVRRVNDDRKGPHDSPFTAAATERILALADNRRIGRYHAALVGLPAAAKSTVIRNVLRDGDHVVVPTNVLKKDWEAKIREMGLDVVVSTQHHIVLNPPVKPIRLLVVDEAFHLESAHFNALALRAKKTIAVGDTAQISGFHVRGQVEHYGLRPEDAMFVIRAPFSLGLPLPVLMLGKRLGFAPKDAVTMNRHGRLLVTDADPKPATSSNALVVFNRSQKTSQRLTAHESQGSRFAEVDVIVTGAEADWVPFTAHFWVAISRATTETRLHLCLAALANLRSAVQGVRGFAQVEFALPSVFESLRPRLPEGFVVTEKLHLSAALLPVTGERGVVGDRPVQAPFREVVQVGCRTVAALTHEEVSDALVAVNLNVDQLRYSDVADLADVEMRRDITTLVATRLDLQVEHRASSSTLPPAGVLFSSRDTKTEIYTIADRYLCNPRWHSDSPRSLAAALVASFDRAYVRPDAPHVSVDGASAYLDWMDSRSAATFRPSSYFFGEDKRTVEFSSFLKAHAKAKNDAGFGSKMEKGQTIAAGDQSYNARFTSLARQLQTALLSVLRDDFILDIGYSEEAFRQKSAAVGLGRSAVNTQIDLSSQDSTHREPHVLALLALVRRYTDATEEECALYLEMRRTFVVRARNFSCDQSVVYQQSWSLPSGDPFTLIANCLQEMTSTAYVFALTPELSGSGAAKGDDQLYNAHLHFGPVEQGRANELGVKFKIEYDLPPFFAGRLFLPTGAVVYDPVKVMAKYSVKHMAAELHDEYIRAYNDLLPPISEEDRHLLLLALQPHHPSMTYAQLQVAIDFSFSLWNRAFFLRFQRSDRRRCLQFVDDQRNCQRAVLRALGYTTAELPKDAPAVVFRAHLLAHDIPHLYLPFAGREELRSFARANADVVVFSFSHAVTYTDTSRVFVS